MTAKQIYAEIVGKYIECYSRSIFKKCPKMHSKELPERMQKKNLIETQYELQMRYEDYLNVLNSVSKNNGKDRSIGNRYSTRQVARKIQYKRTGRGRR